MARLPLLKMLALTAILAGAASGPGHADPSSQSASTGGKFEYGPYGSPGNPSSNGSGQVQSTYRNPDAAPPQGSDDGANAGPPPNDGGAEPAPGPAYRGDARQDGDPNAEDEADDRAGGSPPRDEGPAVRDGREPFPGQAAGPPPGGYEVGLPRIEVRASAPDRSIPYEVREQDTRRAAIQAWRGKVADQFGPQFAQWRDAIGKRVDCHPDPREGLVCIAGAQPVRGLDRYGQGPRDRPY